MAQSSEGVTAAQPSSRVPRWIWAAAVLIAVLGSSLTWGLIDLGLGTRTATDLGVALLGGVIVAFAVLVFERSVEGRQFAREKQEAARRRRDLDARRRLLEELCSAYFGDLLIETARDLLDPQGPGEPYPDDVLKAPFTIEGVATLVEAVGDVARLEGQRFNPHVRRAIDLTTKMIPYVEAVPRRVERLLPTLIEVSDVGLIRAMLTHAELCERHARVWRDQPAHDSGNASQRLIEIVGVLISHQDLLVAAGVGDFGTESEEE